MPGTLVNKNWIVGPGDGGRHGHECGCCHDDTERAERNAELERWIQEKRDRGSSSGEEDSEDEIDRSPPPPRLPPYPLDRPPSHGS